MIHHKGPDLNTTNSVSIANRTRD